LKTGVFSDMKIKLALDHQAQMDLEGDF